MHAIRINLIVTVIQLAVEPDYIGLASALCLVSRSVGGAVGTAIAVRNFNCYPRLDGMNQAEALSFPGCCFPSKDI